MLVGLLGAEFIRANQDSLRELQARFFPHRYPRVAKKLGAPRYAHVREASDVSSARAAAASCLLSARSRAMGGGR
jgi:hypothetical protein